MLLKFIQTHMVPTLLLKLQMLLKRLWEIQHTLVTCPLFLWSRNQGLHNEKNWGHFRQSPAFTKPKNFSSFCLFALGWRKGSQILWVLV
jgi:hypothetical protein